MELILRCVWMLVVLEVCSTRSLENRLLIVSFDGFRHDYFNRSLTPNFNELMRQSAYSERVVNVFPTLTFPNHFSIATGSYVEDHGVLANAVRDSKTHETLNYGYKLFHYNERIVPIWTLNELKNGRHSGCMMWPGCDMPYRATNPTYSVSFNLSIPWDVRINRTLSWFVKPTKTANLAMLYFESPDEMSHPYGPDSSETNAQISRADKVVGKLLDSMKSMNLTDLNLIVLSDHGMETVTLPRIINLTATIKGEGEILGTSPVLQIYPKEGKIDALYQRLADFSKLNGHFDVYKNKDIPEAYRYKNCDRAPPILAVARPKYAFQDLYDLIDYQVKTHNITLTNQTQFGIHGYDPQLPAMQPFLMARGPKFDKGLKIEPPLHTVDLYGIFSAVLELESPEDGIVRPKLSQKVLNLVHEKRAGKADTSIRLGLCSRPSMSMFALASVFGLTTLFIVFIMFQRRQNMRNLGYTLVDKDESGV